MAKKPTRPRDQKFVRLGTIITTEDGYGTTIGMSMRRNTNGGPGARQYVVRLEDGRVRHYSRHDFIPGKMPASGSRVQTERGCGTLLRCKESSSFDRETFTLVYGDVWCYVALDETSEVECFDLDKISVLLG
jgi:hypothetical protein